METHATSWVPAGLLAVWFGLTLVAALYVAWDLFARTPERKVMKWGWILVTLYTGPVGADLLLVRAGSRSPARTSSSLCRGGSRL